MRIYVKVVPRSSQNKVEQTAKNEYKVWVTVVPEKGKANDAVVKNLAKYFKIAKSRVIIIAGRTTRIKIIDIEM
jgi:uncharacterized protein YggU (UPF0235/DUF167 family)